MRGSSGVTIGEVVAIGVWSSPYTQFCFYAKITDPELTGEIDDSLAKVSVCTIFLNKSRGKSACCGTD